MKKRYTLVAIASIMLLSSVALMVNKNSFAEPDDSNQCLDTIELVVENKEEVYVTNENNRIDLPYGRFYRQPKSASESNDYRFFIGNSSIFNKIIYQNTTSEELYYMIDSTWLYKANNDSVLMNYLINETTFSDDKNKDDYYKQLLILWAMDRLAGYEDDKNYIWDENSLQIIETQEDIMYDDKYDVYNNSEEEDSYKEYYWKYGNNLSAGDKKLLKASEVGDKMLSYLDTWEEYVNWYIEENQQVELDPITQEDISYQVTDDYIETNLITPKATGKVYKNKFKSYQVDVSSPMMVVDEQGEERTSFNAGESFKIRIPISEIKNKTLTYSINIKGSFSFDSLVLYQAPSPARYESPSDERMSLYNNLSNSHVTRNCINTNTLDTILSLNYTQQVGNLNIKVIDVETKENLSNAEITIYDSLGNIVYRMNTTNSEINVTLPIGEYTVKQTITPENYQPIVVQKRVSVTENETTEAVLENIQLLEVPNLGRNTTGIIMIIGGLVLVIGCIIVGVNLRKKDIKTKN